jgi:hypothetical protein
MEGQTYRTVQSPTTKLQDVVKEIIFSKKFKRTVARFATVSNVYSFACVHVEPSQGQKTELIMHSLMAHITSDGKVVTAKRDGTMY